MIAPILEVEPLLQINDKTRLDATKSFVSKGQQSVHNVWIEAEAGAGFISVNHADFKNWYLDWVYSGSARTVTVSCRIQVGGNNGPIETKTTTIQLVTAAGDKLFSADSDLTALEPDILKWVKKGRSSFLDVHRMAQNKILEYLDEAGLRNEDGTKITKNELLDLSEVRPWSRDLTLSLIFRGLSNQVGDVFDEKAKHYASEAKNRADRAVIAWDWNKDGTLEDDEKTSLQSVVMER
jgi:hypothetical protein